MTHSLYRQKATGQVFAFAVGANGLGKPSADAWEWLTDVLAWTADPMSRTSGGEPAAAAPERTYHDEYKDSPRHLAAVAQAVKDREEFERTGEVKPFDVEEFRRSIESYKPLTVEEARAKGAYWINVQTIQDKDGLVVRRNPDDTWTDNYGKQWTGGEVDALIRSLTEPVISQADRERAAKEAEPSSEGATRGEPRLEGKYFIWDAESQKQRADQAECERNELFGVIQRLQPPGSPPPYPMREHALWIVQSIATERDELRQQLKSLEGIAQSSDILRCDEIAELKRQLAAAQQSIHEVLTAFGKPICPENVESVAGWARQVVMARNNAQADAGARTPMTDKQLTDERLAELARGESPLHLSAAESQSMARELIERRAAEANKAKGWEIPDAFPRLRFHWDERDKWHTVEESPPSGDYLASDGVSTWVIQRESDKEFGPNTRVKFWRSIGDPLLRPTLKQMFDSLRQALIDSARGDRSSFNPYRIARGVLDQAARAAGMDLNG